MPETKKESLVVKATRYGLVAIGGYAVAKGWVSQEFSDSTVAWSVGKVAEFAPIITGFAWSWALDKVKPRLKWPL